MSIFDFNSISETVYKGAIPHPDWILVPEGDWLAQCTNIDGREVEGRRVEGTFLFAELSWEILDEDVKKQCNMEHPTARQSFSLAMTKEPPYRLDLGPNQNMALKGIWKACGITKDPTVNKIKNQTAFVHVSHVEMIGGDGNQINDMDGKPQYRAVVTRVTSIEAARAAQRKPNGA